MLIVIILLAGDVIECACLAEGPMLGGGSFYHKQLHYQKVSNEKWNVFHQFIVLSNIPYFQSNIDLQTFAIVYNYIGVAAFILFFPMQLLLMRMEP